MHKQTYSCIIPFFNERDHITRVVSQLVKLAVFDQIICVDDGSSDGSAKVLKQSCSSCTVVGYKKNRGKASAVKYGLKYVTADYTLLFDADLQLFDKRKILLALKALQLFPDIDAILFKHIDEPLLYKTVRSHLLLTGVRIIRTSLLKEVFAKRIKQYALEFAINEHLQNKNSQVYWLPFVSKNTSKFKKWPLKTSAKKTAQFLLTIWGNDEFVTKYYKQWKSFCDHPLAEKIAN